MCIYVPTLLWVWVFSTTPWGSDIMTSVDIKLYVFMPWSVIQSTGWKIKTYHLQTGLILTEISTHLTHKCPPPPNDVNHSAFNSAKSCDSP